MKTKKTNRSTNTLRNRKSERIRVSETDLSIVEDKPDFIKLLRKIGARAGKAAQAEAIEAGLPQLFVRNNEIIKAYPDGKEKIIRGNKPVGGQYFLKIKSSTVFHGKK